MNYSKIRNSVAAAITVTTLITTQVVFAKPVNWDGLNLQDAANHALEYALADQVQTNDKNYILGEWTTQIRSSPIPYLAGVGRIFKTDEEASAFTTASVISVLAQTYLDSSTLTNNSVLQKIPSAIQRGTESFVRYQSGAVYNFYPEYITKKGTKVRRPIAMRILPTWNGFVNIPNDADTTSVTNAALLLNEKVNKTGFTIAPDTLMQFSRFRDTNRKPHYYNKRYQTVETGAYLTWLYDEKDPNRPSFTFASAEKGQRIPFGVNDVDCIVNANVLKVLSLSNNTQLPGYNEACNMINTMIEKDQHARCGIYYPNTMNLSFSLAQAQKAGNKCLKETSKDLIINKILSSQRADGSWLNDDNLHKDPVISTAFAMYALLQFADTSDDRTVKAISYGTKYLLSQAKQSESGQLTWPVDHFFTAAALVRSLVMWESKAYTHAIVGSVLLQVYKLAPNITANDYLQIEIDPQNLKPLPIETEFGSN